MTKPSCRCAFTLLELLVSVALMGMLFAAMSQLLFSMAEVWGRGAQRRMFERHASAVANHLQGMLLAAANPAGAPPAALADTGGSEPAGFLTLSLPEGDRIFNRDGQAPVGVTCSLQLAGDQGLLVRWVAREGAGDSGAGSQRLVMTPFARALTYDYYDRATQNWYGEETPRRGEEGKWLIPVRLRLRFAWGEYQTVRSVAVPGLGGALPAF